MPTLRPVAGAPPRRRIPLVPRPRAELARNTLAWAAGLSAALHVAVIAALIITFPNTPPPEAALPTGVQVVFESGAKQAAAPAAQRGPNQTAQEAAPRAPTAQAPARLAQSQPPAPAPPAQPSPPPPPPPAPAEPIEQPALPPAPKPVTPPPPKPVRPPPPPPPTLVPPTRKPPTPPLPQINLPPPPPPAPAVPTLPPPVPVPAPPAPAVAQVDNAQSEMNLELPPMPELAPIPLPLPPPPLPAAPPPQPPQRLARSRSGARSGALHGGLVMNGLSFSGGGGPSGGMTRGLNLDLPSADQPGSQSDLKVQGDVGANWIAELEQWIDARKYYPEMAGELNQQGTAVIRFSVDRAGHVSHLQLVSPTGYALLDQAWLGLFRGADLPPRPHDGTADIATITASMRFEIIH
jgi:TonB family protein